MAEKLLVPIYLPHWMHRAVLKVKRAFIPQVQVAPVINIWGERYVEWAFLSTEMPCGPGEAIEFGCEAGYMSLLAAQKGFHVLANDLQEQSFTWQHPLVEFRQGDLTPEFQVVTQSFQHPRDEWSGLLNLPSEFTVHSRSTALISQPSE
jgi:hypothetical protein